MLKLGGSPSVIDCWFSHHNHKGASMANNGQSRELSDQYLLTQLTALDIALKAICTQLSPAQASGALGLIQQFTSDFANFTPPQNAKVDLSESVPKELVSYQKILLKVSSGS
nr:MAG TPA: hypothetical protein [Caudoviricetes sp.]